MTIMDYTDNNIVNLMASIWNAIWNWTAIYPELSWLKSVEIEKYKNIVLLVVDGLGYEFLLNNQKQVIHNFEYQKIQSVFPSATSIALTSFATGLPAQQHGITWWYMLFKELGIVWVTLPFCSRINWVPFSESGINADIFFNKESLFEKSKRENYIINREFLINTEYTRATGKNTSKYWYIDFNGLCTNIENIIAQNNEKKYIYAYDPEFDWLSHKYWINSNETYNYSEKIFTHIKELINHIKGTDTLLLITADHWLIDTTDQRTFFIEDYPEIKNMLSLPLCWETRVIYCYVKATKKEEFMNAIKDTFGNICDIYDSNQLIKEWYFGLYETNPELENRVWDFTIIMKENYVLLDSVINQKREKIVGHHWGISKEELYIPLIKISC